MLQLINVTTPGWFFLTTKLNNLVGLLSDVCNTVYHHHQFISLL